MFVFKFYQHADVRVVILTPLLKSETLEKSLLWHILANHVAPKSTQILDLRPPLH